MGEKRSFRPRLSVENPKGFYENIRFRALSDRILHESAYDVKSWNPLIPSIRASGVTGFRVRRLIEECCRAWNGRITDRVARVLATQSDISELIWA